MFDLFGPAYPQSYGQHPYGRKQYYDPEEYAYLLQRQRQEEARREALKRKELERLYLQQQYEREQAYLEQQERQRLIQKKIQEEKKRRKAEKKKRQEEERILEEERKKAQLWAEYVNNPEVREKSATTIQSTWRGYSERRNQVLERLRKLSPFQNRIVQLLAENQTFLNDLIQNPLPSILETFEENEKKSNKDLLWKVAAYEEQLTKELLNLDAISSGRSEFVRNCRRDLVNKINAHLELIDPVKKQLSQRQSEINEKERLFLEEKERLQKQLEEEQIIATESEETPMEETAVQHPQELENVKEEESRETEPDYQVSDITEDGFEIIPSEVEKETPMELEDNSSHDDSTPTTLSKEEELLQIIAKLKQENEEKDMIISQLRSHLESKNQSETQAM